jgi:hypothetical protein
MERVRHIASTMLGVPSPTSKAEAPTPLDTNARLTFLRDGYWVRGLDELGPAFHHHVGARAREIWQNTPGQGSGDHGWLSLEPALLQVLRAPTFMGAMQSILGRDFQIACPWANRPDQGGMFGLHITAEPDHDQAYHKDGTDHGNTQSTVRDIRQRQVIMMYYPLGASLAQGPTAVVPGSQYLSCDRGPMPAGSEVGLSGGGSEGGGPMPRAHAQRDEWLRRSMGALAGGASGDAFENKLVTVPIGGVIITHHQLFHRASRAQPSNFRPMFKLGAARLSEPLARPPAAAAACCPTPATLVDPSTTTGVLSPTLLRCMWSYLHGMSAGSTGGRPAALGCVRQHAAALMARGGGEVERLEAAHTLAQLASTHSAAAAAAAASSDDGDDGEPSQRGAKAEAEAVAAAAALAALVTCFRAHLSHEGASRCAMYRLRAISMLIESPDWLRFTYVF